jgi:hypothetical protein
LFFFAIFGNTTYALSICAKSMDKEYLVKNGGWLAGKWFALTTNLFANGHGREYPDRIPGHIRE